MARGIRNRLCISAKFFVTRLLCIAGIVALCAGIIASTGCSPSNGEIVDVQPLIVDSRGTDISNQKPALARPQAAGALAQPGAAVGTGGTQSAQSPAPTVAGQPSALTKPAKSISFGTAKASKTKSAQQHRRTTTTNQVASQQASTAAPSASQPSSVPQTPRVMLSCTGRDQLRDPKAPWPDTVALQGIITGQHNTALLDGKLYAVGDHFGPEDCAWTVSEITSNSLTLERPQDDRTFAVTIYRDQQMPTLAVRK